MYRIKKLNILKKTVSIVCSAVLVMSMCPGTIYAADALSGTTANDIGSQNNTVTYEIVFDANTTLNDVNGDNMDSQKIVLVNGETVTSNLNANKYSRDGFIFNGWTLSDPTDGTKEDKNLDYVHVPDSTILVNLIFDEEITYQDGTEAKTKKVTRNLADYADKDNKITLKASWTEDTSADIAKVVFDSNGGNGSMKTQTFKYDNTPSPLNKCTFTNDTAFLGWNTKANGRGTFIPDGTSLTNLGFDYDSNGDGTVENYDLNASVKNKVLILYAQWEASTKTANGLLAKSSILTGSEPLITTNSEYVEDADNDISALTLKNTAAGSVEAAANSLMMTSSLSKNEATALSSSLFTSLGAPIITNMPSVDGRERSGDGTSIESVKMKWITADTIDDGVAEHLDLQTTANTDLAVRMEFDYHLSGEYDYAAGDIVITIPAYMFKDRNGNEYGILTVPYPEDPSKARDFNYKRIGDTIVITNTTKMSAATKGFIQFSVSGLTPAMLVDSTLSDDFYAVLEVTTNAGNSLALESEHINATVDTQIKVDGAYKNTYSNAATVVPASYIPESLRTEGESSYLVITWYTYANRAGNQYYNLNVTDEMGSEYKGFIMYSSYAGGNQSAETMKLSTDVLTNVYGLGLENHALTSTYVIKTAYPISQFTPGNTYTFTNTATYTLTEEDPAIDDDEQMVTTTSKMAQLSWTYRQPAWTGADGTFQVYKWGNDNDYKDVLSSGDRVETTHSYYYSTQWNSVSDVYNSGSVPYYNGNAYGKYDRALNDLDKNTDVDISYTLDSIGYLFPWTLKASGDKMKISDYYNRSVTMTTYDTGLSVGGTKSKGTVLTPLTDYTYKSVEILTPIIYSTYAVNIDADGNVITSGDGVIRDSDGQITDPTFKYMRDTDLTHIPDIKLEVYRNGAWEQCATVSWASGSCVVTYANGTTSTNASINVPADTETFRTTISSASVAGIRYYVRPVVTLKANGAMSGVVDTLFADSKNPSVDVYNGFGMDVSYTDGEISIAKIDYSDDENHDGVDTLYGYTTDTSAYPAKTATFDPLTDVDYVHEKVTVHYSAEVDERTFIRNEEDYERALTDGDITPDTSGTWYDLLPKGMSPITNTISAGDYGTVASVNTIDDYNGSGRTLLVVKVKLTPNATLYDNTYYQDVISISFNAAYSFDDINDYGNKVHNVIAYESGNTSIATADGYAGEPDNPSSTNNIATKLAFSEDADEKALEISAMTNLDKSTDNPNFVYAGNTTTLDILGAGRTSLSKEVQVNMDGEYGTGVYNNDVDDAGNAIHRDVYAGGVYQYRLRMTSDADTISKDLILYDNLETFKADSNNDECDIGAVTWQGTFRGVDVSQLTVQGISPIIYYSTKSGLVLSDESDSKSVAGKDTNLADTSTWIKSTDYTGDLKDVKAIAIDASKNADGTDFSLLPQKSISVLINMRAPSIETAQTNNYLHDDDATSSTTGAFAYNNAYMSATSIDATTFVSSSIWIHKDYTKVGIVPYNLHVTKVWNDDNDRDGYRPETNAIHLYANGVDTGESITTTNDVLTGVFNNLNYCDTDGNKIVYTLVEDARVTAHYEQSLAVDDDSHYTLTNIHKSETISIPVTKEWVGDTAADRPASIIVNLYAGDTLYRSATITANASGEWGYTFNNLYKYENGGSLINYTVDETSSYDESKSYVTKITGNATDGFTVMNTYHPYGNFEITKTVLDGTSVTANYEYALIIEFSQENESGETEPYIDELKYTITDKDGNVSTEKSFAAGNAIKVHAGDKIQFKDVPQYITYTVKENEYPGFTTEYTGEAGTIEPNETATCSVTNTYAASAILNLGGMKILNNRQLNRYQFRFQLLDAASNSLVKTATNEAVKNTEYNDNGSVKASNATYMFGALHYTQADAGSTYEYIISEVNTGKAGYTYDNSIYYAYVTVADNGDGTLALTTTYATTDAEGNKKTVPSPDFTNTYEASGEVDFTSYKVLEGRVDKSGFYFQLKKLDSDKTVLQTKTSSADGTIDFESLKYDQADIGATYWYTVNEVSSAAECDKFVEDSTVTYDKDTVYYIKVEISDYGDGTLSLTMKIYELDKSKGEGATAYDTDDDGTVTINEENLIEAVPVFTNTLKPGSLSIEKHTANADADDGAEFKFHVQLNGTDVPEDGSYEYSIEQITN